MSAPVIYNHQLKTSAFGTSKALCKQATFIIFDNIALMEAFCLALTFHVLLLPIMWFMGFALPWPKPPVVTSIMEIDLENWPQMAGAKKLGEFRDPKLNQ